MAPLLLASSSLLSKAGLLFRNRRVAELGESNVVVRSLFNSQPQNCYGGNYGAATTAAVVGGGAVFSRCSQQQRRPFTSASSDVAAAAAAGREKKIGIVDRRPSPTAYNPVVVNAAVNPEPGRSSSGLPAVLALSVAMIVFPCAISISNMNSYYKATEHLYKDGWSVFHYDKGKNTFLS